MAKTLTSDQRPPTDTGRPLKGNTDTRNTAPRRPRRINVAVTPEMIDAVELIMDRENISLTEAVRRLVSYGDYVYRAIRENDAEVLLREGNKTKEIVLLT